jgi:hypothetical protein
MKQLKTNEPFDSVTDISGHILPIEQLKNPLYIREPINIFGRCPRCNSTNSYYRVRRKDNVCRKCGFTFTVKKETKKKGV